MVKIQYTGRMIQLHIFLYSIAQRGTRKKLANFEDRFFALEKPESSTFLYSHDRMYVHRLAYKKK